MFHLPPHTTGGRCANMTSHSVRQQQKQSLITIHTQHASYHALARTPTPKKREQTTQPAYATSHTPQSMRTDDPSTMSSHPHTTNRHAGTVDKKLLNLVHHTIEFSNNLRTQQTHPKTWEHPSWLYPETLHTTTLTKQIASEMHVTSS